MLHDEGIKKPTEKLAKIKKKASRTCEKTNEKKTTTKNNNNNTRRIRARPM